MLHDPPLLMKDVTAAALLGISRATFWRRVKDGTLPNPIKLGGATRWRRSELVDTVEGTASIRKGIKGAD